MVISPVSSLTSRHIPAKVASSCAAAVLPLAFARVGRFAPLRCSPPVIHWPHFSKYSGWRLNQAKQPGARRPRRSRPSVAPRPTHPACAHRYAIGYHTTTPANTDHHSPGSHTHCVARIPVVKGQAAGYAVAPPAPLTTGPLAQQPERASRGRPGTQKDQSWQQSSSTD